jgi:uncharacterized phage protein gp47/JayE
MATQRPTLKELIERIEQDVTSRLGTGQPARISLMRVLARGIAGIAHGLYGYIDTKEKNFLPDTGDDESVLRWANLFGITRLAPMPAHGTVLATGTNGSVIPAGRELRSSAGVLFRVDADTSVSGGTATIPVTAVDRGISGNLPAGVSLTFTQPVDGVLSVVTVQQPGMVGGSDIESIDALRVRVLDRMKAPPKGGAASDYVQWAKDAHPDVTRAWVSAQELAPNSVTVRFVTDDLPDGPIPSQIIIDTVAAYIEARAPVTADVYVAAPVAVPLDLEIAIEPDTEAVKAAVEAELADLIKREAEPGGTILLSHIREAISNAAGEENHELLSPDQDVVHSTGEIAVLGTIAWKDFDEEEVE